MNATESSTGCGQTAVAYIWAETETKKSFIVVSAHLSATDRALLDSYFTRKNVNARKDHYNIGVQSE